MAGTAGRAGVDNEAGASMWPLVRTVTAMEDPTKTTRIFLVFIIFPGLHGLKFYFQSQ
jgi:hypothetical protein